MRRWLIRIGAVLAGTALSGWLAFAWVGWWIDCGDAPQKSDIIVVLGGGYARPLHAADLYRQGLAPQVWLSRIRHPEVEDRVRALGVDLPPETETNRAILLKKGVPEEAIRLYGDGVNSTVDEAKALARGFDCRGRKVIVVTSRFHARRARMVFRRFLPGARVLVCSATPETFDRRWWRHKELTQFTVMEMLKLANYLVGSPFGRRP